MTRFGYTLMILLGASLGAAACSDSIDTGPPQDDLPPGDTAGSDGNQFMHPNDGIEIWDLIDRLTKEGPPSFSSQMHGCTKPRYATLKNILSGVGINVANATALSAGNLYTTGAAAMGAPNYA